MSAVTDSCNYYAAPCRGDRALIGRGLFASRPIQRGELILTFRGAELSLAEVREKGDLAANALQVGRGLYLDLEEPGRLFNHSCDPNVGVFRGVEVRALRQIATDVELCFDYATTVGDGWTMGCRCDSPACRQVVRAFLTLPESVRLRYVVLGAVSPFLVDQLGA
jgi:uncharacterized protein